MFSQVSKISFCIFILFVVLFQHITVGSENAGRAATATFPKDTLKDSINIISSDSILTKSIVNDSLSADSLHADSSATVEGGLQSPVKYHARDSMPSDIENQIVYLYGAATVDYEEMHLKADYIMIDMAKKEMYAEGLKDSSGNITGSPEFSQGDQQFRSNSMRYNFDTKKGKINYVITKEGEGYIHGETVKKDPENNFFIRKGQYTTCDLDTPHFAITSNRLKVISNNKIVTGPAYLTIEGVPTPLLIPFGFFPNKKGRSSGIIFPSFGESAERGFYFQHLGYYFGFSDYFNVALTSDIYTKGSLTLEATSIYKKRYHYSGNLNLSFANTVVSEPELPDYSRREDFHIRWTHNQDPKLNPNSNFTANVNAGTSSYYQNTISSTNNFLSNTFQSSVSYSHNEGIYNYTIGLNHSQNTITHDIHVTAPDLSFNITRINPFQKKNRIGKQTWYDKIGTSYAFRATNFIDTKDSLLFKQESLDKLKNGFQHTIPISTSFNILKYFNASPSFNYTERWYLKTTQYSYDLDSQKVDTFDVKKFAAARDYQASLGLTTRIYGMYLFSHGPVTALRHVMTPSVSFSYRPDFSKPGFGYYKNLITDSTGREQTYSIFQNTAYGGPPSGRFANIGFGLDNNLEMKVKTNSDTGATVRKVKLLESLQFRSGYNLIADSLRLSPVNVSGRTTLFNKISLSFSGILDPYSVDSINRDYDRYSVSHGGPLVRLTNANISMSFNLNQTKDLKSSKYSKEDLEYINNHPEEYVDFNIPYNLAVTYSFQYTKTGNAVAEKTQSSSFNGDLSLTPRWKIGFNSWYDITNGRFTNLGLNLYRDLHCWEMRLNWIPFGFQESWNFQINVKSSILQDLKLLKRKEFYDR